MRRGRGGEGEEAELQPSLSIIMRIMVKIMAKMMMVLIKAMIGMMKLSLRNKQQDVTKLCL